MNVLISNNISSIKTICKTHHVSKLWVFGSVCTNKFSDKSDIDLLVSFEPMDYEDYADNYLILCNSFENLFKRKVDLLTDKSLSNPYFIKSVDKTKTIIYE